MKDFTNYTYIDKYMWKISQIKLTLLNTSERFHKLHFNCQIKAKRFIKTF